MSHHAFRLLPWLLPVLAVLLAIVTWLQLRDAGLSTELLALAVAAPTALLAYPLAPRMAPLVSIWLVGIAAQRGVSIVQDGWDASGALFWISMIAAAAGVSSSRLRIAVLGWVTFVVGGATGLSTTPDTSFATELVWLGAICGGAFSAARFIALYRSQAVTLRAQALLLEHEREEHARLAAAEERARIARDLHDVVAHSVSLMVMHAGAVRRLLRDDQLEERAALESLEQTGRDSMSEIRRALGVLRRPDEAAARAPQQGIADLDRLVGQLRRTGLDITLVVEGEPVQAAPGVDIAAYRIAQEALTNVVKHAAGARVKVVVRHLPDAVELAVIDDGDRGARADKLPGYGLIGLRERASVLGGTLHAAARDGGGFEVRAHLPTESVT